jgi:hypothetical protein
MIAMIYLFLVGVAAVRGSSIGLLALIAVAALDAALALSRIRAALADLHRILTADTPARDVGTPAPPPRSAPVIATTPDRRGAAWWN